MARTITLTQLKTAVLERADMVGTTFIDQTTELVNYINRSYTALYDILIQKFGDDYFLSTYTFTTDGVADSYVLPAAFYKLLGVDLVLGTNDAITLKPFMFSERNRNKTSIGRFMFDSTNLRYRVQGGQIKFTPLPSANLSITLFYVPTVTDLSAGSDTLDGVNGYEEFIIIDAAIKCLEKEESDTSDLKNDRAAIMKRIEEAAENRDAGASFRVTDVTSSDLGNGIFDR